MCDRRLQCTSTHARAPPALCYPLQCTEEKKPLTAEEKAAKIEEFKNKAAARRAEREGVEQASEGRV